MEMCLHVAQGLPFTRMIECLDHGHALWIAVGGSRELNPYIRKVHTGAARIALQAARHSEYEVLLVPLHLASRRIASSTQLCWSNWEAGSC